MSLAEGMSDLAASATLQDDVAQKLQIDALQKSLSGGKTKEKKLREACQGFESVFISKLFSQMRATVPKDGLLHGQYEDQYYSMFDKAMCDKLSADGGIGLADMMYRQLKGKVLGKDAGQAGEGDILPANRPVTASPSSTTAYDRLPVSGDGLPRSAQAIQAQRFSPSLAPSHAQSLQAARSSGDLQAAAAQAATPISAPVTGDISSEYGWRTDPFKKREAWHAGMDIAAAEGDAVSSCWNGTVVFAGVKGGYGNVVEVEHPGGWTSVYGHLRNYSVKAGDAVAAGGKIAEVGSTGRSTGPHLHFELRREGETVDPKNLLAAAGLLQDIM
jgi:peptidoglycan hydrolase FlgJ